MTGSFTFYSYVLIAILLIGAWLIIKGIIWIDFGGFNKLFKSILIFLVIILTVAIAGIVLFFYH